MRLGLAIRTFFALLLGRPLPIDIIVMAAVAEELPPPKPKPEPEAICPPKAEEPPAQDDGGSADGAAVQVLAVMQSEGRLLDFLSENIDDYSNADVGAAVRDVHRGLRRALKDHFPVVPVRTEAEESSVTVPEGFDPAQIRLVGNVVGKPPFSGKLKHKGWRVGSVRLPRIPAGEAAHIAAPAEVEL